MSACYRYFIGKQTTIGISIWRRLVILDAVAIDCDFDLVGFRECYGAFVFSLDA